MELYRAGQRKEDFFMHVKFQMTDDILIASVFGELDHHSAAAVRDEFDQTMEAFQCRHLILDFESNVHGQFRYRRGTGKI